MIKNRLRKLFGWIVLNKTFDSSLIPIARELRAHLTPAEQRLWSRISYNQLNVRFHRQAIIKNCIVDFYSPDVELIIEVDGAHHFEPAKLAQDVKRDAYLQSQGYRVLRFDNNQVMKELPGVLEMIYEVIQQRLHIVDFT